MASLPLVGTEGLFTRIGILGNLLSSINVNRGTDVPNLVTEINDQYQNTDQNIITNLYNFLSFYQTSAGNFGPNIRSMAQATVIQMVNDVSPQIGPALQSAMAYVIAQMKTTSNTVQSNHVSETISASASNVGNPVTVCSLRDVTGHTLEYSFSENITGTCTNDSFTSAALAGSEPMLFQGQPSVFDALSWLYPAGSGSSINIAAINPLIQGGLNWTVNGSMESWTNSIPNGWHIVTGTPGATVYRATYPDTFYDGTSGLAFAGIGSENTEIRQQFSTALFPGDMRQTLFPYNQLSLNLFVMVAVETGYGTGPYSSGYYSGGTSYGSGGYGDGGYSAGSPGGLPGGVLRIAMTDGAGVVADSSGIPNELSIDVSTLGSGWSPVSGAFRTSATLPDPVYLDLAMTTPLSTGSTLYIDRIGMATMTQVYQGGPFISVYSGNQNMAKGDSVIVAMSNDYDGKNQSLFDQLFNMRQLGLILPSSDSPTIPD